MARVLCMAERRLYQYLIGWDLAQPKIEDGPIIYVRIEGLIGWQRGYCENDMPRSFNLKKRDKTLMVLIVESSHDYNCVLWFFRLPNNAEQFHYCVYKSSQLCGKNITQVGYHKIGY